MFFVFGRWERAGETGEGVSGYRSGAGYPPNMKNANVFAFFVFERRIAAEIEKRAIWCSATGHGIVGGGERVLEENSKK